MATAFIPMRSSADPAGHWIVSEGSNCHAHLTMASVRNSADPELDCGTNFDGCAPLGCSMVHADGLAAGDSVACRVSDTGIGECRATGVFGAYRAGIGCWTDDPAQIEQIRHLAPSGQIGFKPDPDGRCAWIRIGISSLTPLPAVRGHRVDHELTLTTKRDVSGNVMDFVARGAMGAIVNSADAYSIVRERDENVSYVAVLPTEAHAPPEEPTTLYYSIPPLRPDPPAPPPPEVHYGVKYRLAWNNLLSCRVGATAGGPPLGSCRVIVDGEELTCETDDPVQIANIGAIDLHSYVELHAKLDKSVEGEGVETILEPFGDDVLGEPQAPPIRRTCHVSVTKASSFEPPLPREMEPGFWRTTEARLHNVSANEYLIRGGFARAHNSKRRGERIECSVAYVEGRGRHAACGAVTWNNAATALCATEDPEVIDVLERVHDQGHLTVHHSEGRCTGAWFEVSSGYPPKNYAYDYDYAEQFAHLGEISSFVESLSDEIWGWSDAQSAYED